MERFEEVLERNKCRRRTFNSSTTIEQLEDIIKFILPTDYRKFLVHYVNFEGFIGPEFLRLWALDELVDINVNYGIFSSLPSTLGIGTNGSGEFIAIELDQGNVRIILSPFIGLDKRDHLEIGNSFSDFLIRLDNGEPWFK